MPDESTPPRWGHSIGTHRLFGWCAQCPKRSLADEVVAWRGWAVQNVPEVREAIADHWPKPGDT